MTGSNVILRALKQAVKVVQELGADYCLFGGLAMQAYRRIRATMDVDLMVAVDKNDIANFISKLEMKGLKVERERGMVKVGGFELLRFIYVDKNYGLEIFVDIAIVKTEFQKQILSRKQQLNFLGMKVNLASCEDLILLKVLAGRPIDRVDAEVLIQENSGVIDRDYLRAQSKELGIGRRLEQMLKNRN